MKLEHPEQKLEVFNAVRARTAFERGADVMGGPSLQVQSHLPASNQAAVQFRAAQIQV
jgi:hypothetical protein